MTDPEQIRESAARILGQPEFGDHRSIFERAADWVASSVLDLLDGIFGGLGGGSGLAGLVSQLILLSIIIGALTLLVLAIRSLWRTGRLPTSGRQSDGLVVVFGQPTNPVDLAREAEEAAAARRWQLALMAQYRLLVVNLITQGALADVPGRTTGEYRIEYQDVRPLTAEDFDKATVSFENAYYGDEPVERSEFDVVKRICETLIGSTSSAVGTMPR